MSLSTGAGCVAALERLGAKVTAVDAGRDLAEVLGKLRPDVAMNVLHGVWGEDGCVQGILEIMGIPYTHSGVLASALAMDKDKSRAIYVQHGLEVAPGGMHDVEDLARDHIMEPPYVIKPAAEGSSFGVFIVRKGANRPPKELTDGTWKFGKRALVEKFIEGRELTVGVMGDRAMAVTEITTLREYYDYAAKYQAGGSRHVVPADLPKEVTEAALAASLKAHQALGCRGVTRSDFRYDDKADRLVILETNTQPGMTPTSLVPEQAAYLGIGYSSLVRWMIEDASCPR